MKANHNLLAGGILVGSIAMFALACSAPLPVAAPQSDVDSLLVILMARGVPDTALVNRILSTAPNHPDSGARTHVQCHFVRNIRTRLTLAQNPDTVQDIDGPSGELCAVENGYVRGQSKVHGAWIATARIDSVVVPGALTDVPHLGMTPGVNHILAARRGSGHTAVVFPPGGVPLLIRLELDPDFKPNQGMNGIDIAVWRGNAMSGCISCWRRGWCTVGD